MHTLNCRGNIIDIRKPLIMGILNITNDSFYSGSRTPELKETIAKAGKMLESGASILDIGGVSTRSGSSEIPMDIELNRIIPAISTIKERFPHALISVDTYRSKVAEKAIVAGADIINDISSGDIDPETPLVAQQYHCPYIAMHMQGRPSNMQINPHYKDVLTEILDYFIVKLAYFKSINLIDVIFDPGFGFGKSIQHNYALLNNLEIFQILDKPILAGLSRKGMLWKPLNSNPDEVLPATIAVNLLALQKGAIILRVHDVEEAVQLVNLFEIINQQTL